MISASVVLVLLVVTASVPQTRARAVADSFPFNEIVELIEKDAALDVSSPTAVLKRMADEIIERVPGAAIVRPIRDVSSDIMSNENQTSSFSHELPGGKHEQMTMIVNGEAEVIGNFSYTNEDTGEVRMTTYKTNKNGTMARTTFQIRQKRRAALAKSLVG